MFKVPTGGQKMQNSVNKVQIFKLKHQNTLNTQLSMDRFQKQNKRVAQGKFRVEKPEEGKGWRKREGFTNTKEYKRENRWFRGTHSFLLKSFFDY